MRVCVVSLLLLASLVLSIMAFSVHGDDLRQDFLEWALQNATRPEWMPPLEEYGPLVESFINTSECRAKINYVAVFYNAASLYNSSLRLWANYVKVFDLLRGGTATVLISGLGWSDADFSIRLDINKYGYPLLYFILDEDLYDQGFLYGILFIRINETHVYNFTAFRNDLMSNPGKWFNPRDYAVYCPHRSGSLERTVTVTETVTSPITETLTHRVTETAIQEVTLTETRVHTVTETALKTHTVTETNVVTKTSTYTPPAETHTVTETTTVMIRETKTETIEVKSEKTDLIAVSAVVLTGALLALLLRRR